MVGKSTRYFHNSSSNRNRSNSPGERNSKSASHRSLSSTSSSSSSASHRISSSSNSGGSSSKFADNKSASDRLRKTLRGDDSSKHSPAATSTSVAPNLSVEEQVKRANAIDEINNYNPFLPKSFTSNRAAAAAAAAKLSVDSINLSDIPLPKDLNSWKENPKLLIDSSLYIGTVEDRRKRWYENLVSMKKQLCQD